MEPSFRSSGVLLDANQEYAVESHVSVKVADIYQSTNFSYKPTFY